METVPSLPSGWKFNYDIQTVSLFENIISNINLLMQHPLNHVFAIVDVRLQGGIDVSSILSTKLRSLGAHVSKTFSWQTTHVIFHHGSSTLKKQALQSTVYFVSPLWIDDCLKQNSCVNESSYFPIDLKSKTKNRMEPTSSRVKPRKKKVQKENKVIVENILSSWICKKCMKKSSHLYACPSCTEKEGNIENSGPDHTTSVWTRMKRSDTIVPKKTFTVEQCGNDNNVETNVEIQGRMDVETSAVQLNTIPSAKKPLSTVALMPLSKNLFNRMDNEKQSATKQGMIKNTTKPLETIAMNLFDLQLAKKPSPSSSRVNNQVENTAMQIMALMRHTPLKAKKSKQCENKKIVCCFTGGLENERKVLTTQLQKLVHVRVVDARRLSIEHITHVIALEDNVKRSLKVLFGLARQAWIIKSSWVLASIQSGHLVPENEHTVKTYPNTKSPIPFSLPLERIFIHPQILPPADSLRALLHCLKAKVVDSLVMASLAIANDTTLLRRSSKLNIPVVSPTWIFDSLVAQKSLPRTAYMITGKKSSVYSGFE